MINRSDSKENEPMKRIVSPGLFMLAGSVFTLPALAQDFPPVEMEIIQLNDDMYVIHNEFVPGNVTVLATDEGVLLVDDKFEANYQEIVDLVASVTDQPVRYVVNTHYHFDHSGSNAAFQAAGAQVVASEQARARMLETGQTAGLPVLTTEDHARIHLGGKIVDLFRFGRAHTDGDMVVYFPQYQVLSTGDLFTYGNATPLLIDYAGGGSIRAWTNTLDDILMLGFETVVPGHGVVTDRAAMEEFQGIVAAMRARTREMIAAESSREEIEAMLREEFYWQDLHLNMGFDGLLAEL